MTIVTNFETPYYLCCLYVYNFLEYLRRIQPLTGVTVVPVPVIKTK
jgi:hypothetical protein